MQGIFRRLAQAVAGLVLAGGLPSAADAATCSRYTNSSPAKTSGVFNLPWRTDLPASPGTATHAWEAVPLTNWQAYMNAVLSEVRASGLKLQGDRVVMNATAEWWITPWMDYTPAGREKRLGLTKEREADPRELSPNSPGDEQVWAVGFYNREGASALAQVFANPCDPVFPTGAAAFPAETASFKLLFTNASAAKVTYLSGGPQVKAYIGPAVNSRTLKPLRLLQMDIAVKDARSPTGWVFGTYIWKSPATGDKLLDNLVPVGLMWGNDPAATAAQRDDFATLGETRLNTALAGVVWRGPPPQTWAERPWPGFQGRLNGPADNLRSSCLSCHALAQWPRSKIGIVPSKGTYSLANLATATVRDDLRTKYLRNTAAGALTEPAEGAPGPGWDGAKALDYSLQLEAAFERMCRACNEGALTGATPAVCRVNGLRSGVFVSTPMCPAPTSAVAATARSAVRAAPEPPPRQ
jgi:hypothetical protein